MTKVKSNKKKTLMLMLKTLIMKKLKEMMRKTIIKSFMLPMLSILKIRSPLRRIYRVKKLTLLLW
jgi:hypothetical protein